MLVDTTEYREFHTADEAEHWANIHYPDICGEQCKNNPDYERLFFYSGSCYKMYNKALRFGWEYSDDTMREIWQLVYILDKYKLPEPVIAYRYTHKKDLKLLFQGERLRPGMHFADKGFFSSSLVKSSLEDFRKKYKRNCMLKLYLPKGVPGAYISLRETSSVLNEQELLLQRDTEFEIIKIHHFCHPMVIECKAVIKPTLEV